MRVAMPLFGSRISPRCQFARAMVVAEVSEGRITSHRTLAFDAGGDTEVIENLRELEIDLLVCGGVRREFMEEIEANGIAVICNVAGEADAILEALSAGELRSGYGLGGTVEPLMSPPATATPVDCVACAERSCTRGQSCPVDLGPFARPRFRGRDARIYEAARDLAAETDPKLCRIAELVHFGLEAGYHRIGLAFCWELYREVETLTAVLSRFFSVVPVCCRIGVSGSDSQEGGACNPIAQARILKESDTDLNVIAGLCLGSDVLFTERSHAPVTTLFVKDRSLAHNPVGAIYTRYHLEDLERGRPLVRSGRN